MMEVAQEQLELLLREQMSAEELVQVLVGLIRYNPEVRKAILGVVQKCPNIVAKV